MAAHIRLSIGSIALVSAFRVLILGVAILGVAILGAAGSAGAARAADCLSAPGPSASPNSHWYYRTDRAQNRKCWYLRGADGSSQDDAGKTTQSASSAAPDSLENFKAFIAQRGIANLSDKDVESLYAEFLAWRRRPGNEAKEN